MTAPFLPLAFRAEGGSVLFEGRQVPDFRAIALRHRLTSKAIDPAMGEFAAGVFWSFRDQLAKAIAEARQQRRAGFRLISTTTPTPERAAS